MHFVERFHVFIFAQFLKQRALVFAQENRHPLAFDGCPVSVVGVLEQFFRIARKNLPAFNIDYCHAFGFFFAAVFLLGQKQHGSLNGVAKPDFFGVENQNAGALLPAKNLRSDWACGMWKISEGITIPNLPPGRSNANDAITNETHVLVCFVKGKPNRAKIFSESSRNSSGRYWYR